LVNAAPVFNFENCSRLAAFVFRPRLSNAKARLPWRRHHGLIEMETFMTAKRNRRTHDLSFEERLRRAATLARDAAQRLPGGHEREVLLKKADQADNAARINRWLTSPGQYALK
jgi:hypothetical protein